MTKRNPRLWLAVPIKYIQILDELVKVDAYLNRGDAGRSALRLLFRHHDIELMDWEADER